MSGPRLTVVIGANGAGKTTWARRHRDTLPKPFYNADSIAEGLGDANDAALQRAARKLVDERIEGDLGTGNTFGFESTYSGRSRPDIVRTAKRLGYTRRAVFLGTETAAGFFPKPESPTTLPVREPPCAAVTTIWRLRTGPWRVRPSPSRRPTLEEVATMTAKGQINVPKRIRDALGADAGTKMTFELHGAHRGSGPSRRDRRVARAL